MYDLKYRTRNYKPAESIPFDVIEIGDLIIEEEYDKICRLFYVIKKDKNDFYLKDILANGNLERSFKLFFIQLDRGYVIKNKGNLI